MSESPFKLCPNCAKKHSRLIRFYLQEAYKVTGIDGGVNFNAGMIEQTPTPKLSQNIITVLEKFQDTGRRRSGGWRRAGVSATVLPRGQVGEVSPTVSTPGS